MSFAVTDISPATGARIEADKATLVNGSRAGEIRALLESRGVLVFPGIGMDDEQQLAFAHTLGDVVELHGEPIYKVTLDETITASAAYLLGTFDWHFDGWSDELPALGSILSAKKLSKIGGQTEFANTYAAYEALSEERKQELAGLRVVHTMAGTQRRVIPDPTPEMRAEWEERWGKIHPFVWTHKSGRRSLLLGSSADWVEGMDKDAGRAMIADYQAWATQPAFVYRHEWQVGDMVIWDNCGSLHRVEPYPSDSGRMMHRVTLEGEEAIA